MPAKTRILASAGPMDRILEDNSGKLRSFPDVMYEFYSWDARRFIAGQLKQLLDNPPPSFHELPRLLREKAQGLLILELVAKLCESAEDLAAFAVAFASELYMDAVAPEDVWKNLAEYKTGDIVNFYRDIKKRKPEYFANLHGYPPLHLQQSDVHAVLLRSCRQLAAYLGHVSDEYLTLRELHNACKHGMRAFFGHVTDKRTGGEVVAVAYVNEDAKVMTVEFPPETVKELHDLCSGIGVLLGAMLHWHRLRMQVSRSGSRKCESPVFGKSTDTIRQLGPMFFPSLHDIKTALVSKGEEIAIRKSDEISRIPRGHIIAIDIDLEEILPYHSADLRDVIWEAMGNRPCARLVFRRISSDGKVGPY
ncbi:hypothetical protein MUP07_03100 [Candidatus Bathyarchaeota archaeon]|nr:hypothetical protein [Candidatus Bathyarchaeota archaeon]